VLDTVPRRLELLKLEGEGFSQSEIVKGLSKQYQCTPRTVRYDFAKRGEWQPKLMEVGDTRKIVLKTANRFESIYQKAAFRQRHAQSERSELRALEVMRQAARDYLETLIPNQAKLDVNVTLPRPFIIRKWSREDADKPKTE